MILEVVGGGVEEEKMYFHSFVGEQSKSYLTALTLVREGLQSYFKGKKNKQK